MLEIVLFAAVALVLFYGVSLSKTKRWLASILGSKQLGSPPKQESFSGNQFLLQLQQEIEDGLFPRPTDSVLVRHYDSLVAAHLEERLANMPN